MRLICFTHSSGLRGAERSLADLVAGLVKRGIECHAIMPDEGPLRALLLSIGASSVQTCGNPRIARVWSWANPGRIDDSLIDEFSRLMLPEIEALNADAVLSQTIVSPWGALCAEFLKLPHVVSVREYGQLDHGLEFPLGFQDCVKALYETSEKVFCVSNDVRSHLFPDDSSERTQVIYSNIRLPQTAQPAPLKKTPANKRPGMHIGIFGSIHPSKGQLDLVRGCALARKHGTDMTCHLYGDLGDDFYVDEIKNEISENGIEPYVVIHDFTPDVVEAMSSLQAVICCSRREAMGRSLIEAALLRVPIIFINAGGHAEVFRDGLEGLAYEPGDIPGLGRILGELAVSLEAATARADRALERCTILFSEENYAGSVAHCLRNLPHQRTGGHNDAVWRLISKTFQPTAAQLFIAEHESGFSEAFSKRISYLPGRRIILRFVNLTEIADSSATVLRLDPADRPGLLQLHRVELIDHDGQPIHTAIKQWSKRGVRSGLIDLNEDDIPNGWIVLNDDPWIILPKLSSIPEHCSGLEVEVTFCDGGMAAGRLITRMASATFSGKKKS